MSIILNNSNTHPYTFNGVYDSIIKAPSTYQSSANARESTEVLAPDQVTGLVPVFPCCTVSDPKAGFIFGNWDSSSYGGVPCDNATTVFQISFMTNGTTTVLGTVSTTMATSNATIQTLVNAILPPGFSCTVSSTSPSHRTVIISAPTGSGTTYNLTQVYCDLINNGCGGTIYVQGFNGGVNSDCLDCDCRQGNYLADSIADDRYFQLPVFASNQCSDSYHNDVNSWFFQYSGTYNPISNGDFKLQQLINGVWTTIATLNNTTYGTPFYVGTTCKNNYGGFTIKWNSVLNAFGEGIYRFYVSGSYNGTISAYCFFSPPFCLKTFDCNLTNGTVKFETNSCGGTFGSVTSQGDSWSICCKPLSSNTIVNNSCTPKPLQAGQTAPLPYNDSIRFPGYFGRELADYQETFIKLGTGVIQTTREEAIKAFTLDSDLLPFWFHQRFYSYGLMADNVYVSDYNLNNPNYNYKHFSVKRDSSYPIKYDNNSLRMKKIIGLKFKEGIQFTFKDGCC